jgi:outer membrane protein
MERLQQFFKAAACVAVCLLAFGSIMVLPAKAAAEPAVLPIGIIDYGQLIMRHPDTAKADETLRAEADKAQKEYNAQATKLSDAEKQNLQRQLSQQLVQKRQELLKPIADKVNAAIKEVITEKNLSMVVYKSTVFFGGQDITEDVLKKIGAI